MTKLIAPLFFALLLIVSCSQVHHTNSTRKPNNLGAQVLPFPGTEPLEPLFGMEVTLTSEAMKEAGERAGGNTINTSANEKAQRKLIEKILDRCGECEVDIIRDKYDIKIGRILYPDGHYFDVTLDPWVVEVTGKPIPASRLIEITKRIQTDIFDIARELGYQPGLATGGGHMHFGLKGLFNNDGQLFRDFMVDMYNHSEIGSGILNYDHANSPPINVLPEKSHRAFWNIIDDFDRSPTSLKKLAKEIFKKVHKRTVMKWTPAHKYQGINLSRVVKDMPYDERTIELRFIRPQQSGEQFKLTAEMITRRVEFLREQRRLGVVPELNIEHPQTMEAKFNAFVRFIEETGDPAEKYFRLLPGEYGQMCWDFIKNKYPNEPARLWVFLQQFAEDVPYDEEIKANFILGQLEQLQELGPRQEKVMGTLLERSYQAPFFERIKTTLQENAVWAPSRTAEVFQKYLSEGKSFHKNCRRLMLDIMFPFPREN